ncbi:MAG: DEAD/DEAH box helicase, partial [Pseudomonas sp.]|nr:DEAD/DEAH box helicase [Pseudomonas sp.]
MLKALKKIFGKGDAAPQAVAPAASVTPPARAPASEARPAAKPAVPRANTAPEAEQPATATATATPPADKAAKDKPRRERKPKPQASLWKPEDFVVEPQEGKTRFHDFKLSNELMHAIHDLGFPYCTPIQAQVLGYTLRGQDAIGRAQTGTGKTAAFLISIISQLQQTPPPKERYMGEPRALIIAPTRELVVQIAKDAAALTKYTGLNVMSFVGGMDFDKQLKALEARHCDILVATPGRLLDFNQRGEAHLD